MLRAQEARQNSGSEQQRVDPGGGGLMWWLWDTFLSISPEVTRTDSRSSLYLLLFFFLFYLEFLVTQGRERLITFHNDVKLTIDGTPETI